MAQDKLYKKSIIALFIIAVSGIALFLHMDHLNEKELASVAEQNTLPPENAQPPKVELKGFDNLSEEAAAVGAGNQAQKTGGPQDEIENLLRQLGE